jgi:hypothetical protein
VSTGSTEASSDHDEVRIRRLLTEASQLLGEGRVLLQIWSSPLVEWVFVGLEDDHVVVSDNRQTFGWIAGERPLDEPYLPWSIEKARVAAGRFGVGVVDEGSDGYESYRLRRTVGPEDSIADLVQAVVHAIDGTLALHTAPESPSYGSYFWDHPSEQA